MTRAMYDIRQKAIENMKATIPEIEQNQFNLENSKNMHKRSLDFIGDFEQWCCGVATEKNLQDILVTETALEKFGKALETQVAKEHVNVIQMSKILNNYSVSVEHVMKELENQVGRDFYSLATAEKTTEQSVIENSHHIINLAHSWLDSVIAGTWQKITSDCQNNLVPHIIVSSKVLMEDLLKANQILKRNKQIMAIPLSKIGKYYQLHVASCAFSKNQLIINIKVPIKRQEINYEIKEITTIPFQHNRQVCIIQLDSTLVAIGDDKIIPFTIKEENQCKVKENELCYVPRYASRPLTHARCIEKFLDPLASVELLKKNCVFSCNDNNDDTMITNIKNNDYAVINKEELKLRCKGKKDTIIPKIERVGVYQLNIPCNCVLTGRKEYVSSKYPCNNKAESLLIHHVIPAAWTKIATAITNDHALFSNLTDIINQNWHHDSPVLNISIKPNEMDSDFVPHIYQIGSHLSFFTTFWLLIVTGWIVWLTWRLISIPIILQAIPAVQADKINIILETIEDCMLMTIILIIVIIILVIKRRILTSKLKNDDINMKCDPNGEIRINIFKKTED